MCLPPKVQYFSVTIYLTPLLFTTSSRCPFPSGNHYTGVGVCECLFVLYVCLLLSVLRPTCIKFYGSWLILFDLFSLAWRSQGHPCRHRWQYFTFSYGWVVLHCMYVPHLLCPVLYQRTQKHTMKKISSINGVWEIGKPHAKKGN